MIKRNKCLSKTDKKKNSGRIYVEPEERQSLLLHSCCGPCSTAVVERLAEEFRITLFFYNPCITEEDEYIRRRDTLLEFVEKYNSSREGIDRIKAIDAPYEPDGFFEETRGLGGEPEGGARCTVCFRQRMRRAAQKAAADGYDCFGTTLTVSPHKNYKLISEIGSAFSEEYSIEFLDRDFKKKDGFKRSVEISRDYGLYRQNYCGCIYSRHEGVK